MKKNALLAEAVQIVLILAPFVYLAIIWNQLPGEIPVHYDWSGNPNGWRSKETAALTMASLLVLLYGVLRYLPAIDPRGRLESMNYQKIRFMITLCVSIVTSFMWYAGAHTTRKDLFLKIILSSISLMLAGIGNYMTTLKPNWFVGIRTPWTLESEAVWRKTHRLGGRLMVAGGLLGTVLSLSIPVPYAPGFVIGTLTVISFVPIVYSYISFQQEKAKTSHLQ